MGNKIELNLDTREIHGKKVAKLRKQGIIPAVIYGATVEPTSVQVASGVIEKVYREAGFSTPVHLSVGKTKTLAMIKDVDMDPVKHVLRHVSFHAVSAKEKVVAQVPLVLLNKGENEAEKAGLVVIQALEEIEVKALPADLPSELEVSTDKLKQAGDKILVSDIKIPAGVEVVDNDDGREGTEDDENSIFDLTVASVYEPSALQAANEAAAGDADEADADEVASVNGEGKDPAENKAE